MLGVLALAGASLGCRVAAVEGGSPLQGVVELEETSLGFELGGRLTAVLVNEGDFVETGAVIARIDDELERTARGAREREAEVAQQQVGAIKAGARAEEVRFMMARVSAAKATEDLLKKQLQRQRALLEKGVVALASVDDLDGHLSRASAEREALDHNLKLLRQGARSEDISVAQARAQAAGSALELNDARLVRHELHAPRSGTILDVNFELGEVVPAAAAVVTMADTKQPYVDIFVPQARISAVRMGEPVRVKVDALPGELLGKVEHIARRTEFTPRFLFSERERANLVVRVRIRVEDPKEKLRAGVPAFVRLGARS